MDACKTFLEKHDLPSQAVVQLIEFTLTHNCFFFGKKYFCNRWEPVWILNKNLFSFTNSFKTFIQLSISPTHIHFLDTTIHIRENTIQTTIYRKTTDKPSYLMYDSFHPDHSKHSIIYSQALWYNRICSDTAERNHHLKTLKADFINMGYNPMIVDQYIHAATRIPRTHLLQYKQKPEINWFLLAFRQPPNLKSLITRSALLQPTKNGTYPCGKKHCKKCSHILTSDKIQIPDTLEEYSIYGHYNCSTSNVVYLIQCTKCITGGLYIGETGQSQRKRNTHHRFTITNKKLDTPIGNFNSPHHSIKDLRIFVLKGNFKTDNERKVWEYKLMETFNSLKN
ncbi:hypothetical protein XELAEV_18025086mg [Xenopus laevis]|uniref:Helix-turn-helix domain-containing protein n=1 Tax=Xenopus laevis TaxID=8355 RepID=A0A974CYU1_XENLA|nr:hypothetical protein XELAEV_18025086mg [Xenopus laevis]